MNTVWITNYVALRSKYGQSGADEIWNAIKLAAAPGDKRINLANPGTVPFPAVTTATSSKQNKDAVDRIYQHFSPNYIAIVGAQDVVAFQKLKNPCNDEDGSVWGDLPYACDAAHSTDPSRFRAPTRVVGRIPDTVRGTDPAGLVGLLATAAAAVTRPASDYQDYLGISADVWKGSTSLSLSNIFGSSSKLQISPPKGPNWSASLLATRAHFINCHGVSANPNFYGQSGNSFPVAHSASHISGNISSGSVASAECCYGAELYDPAMAGGQSGICSTFLASGGYGFFGSSTIAYGPPDGNGAADLITQYFMKHVLAGASLGRATLQAQQDFIQVSGLDPVGLKTLSQFYLLGAPHIHPVQKPDTDSHAIDSVLMKGVSAAVVDSDLARVHRRQDLVRKGRGLLNSVVYARPSARLKPGRNVLKALQTMGENLKMEGFDLNSYSVHGGAVPKAAFGKKVAKEIVHLLHGKIAKPNEFFTPTAIVVVRELGGMLAEPRVYHRK